ncbi:MAG: hypothetical protein IT493_10145 [Gammaproteobacteria bacterium]|nr:hypothetical protein [Gammaproteobacteria bacterium]
MQAIDNFQCWRCGASLADEPLPLAREARCRGCGADLHVCRLCTFYDTRVANACREPIADKVNDKTRANFCGYLVPRGDAHVAVDGASAAARAGLDGLFGLADSASTASPTTPDAARDALDDLFRK